MSNFRGLKIIEREITFHTTLAGKSDSTPPIMWGWAARALTGEGSWLDDWKSIGRSLIPSADLN